MSARPALVFFYSLLLGVVFAALVAVGCALWSQPGMARPMDPDDAEAMWKRYGHLLSESPESVPPLAAGFGHTMIILDRTPTERRPAALKLIVETGWPMRCFWGEVWNEHDPGPGPGPTRRVRCVYAPDSLGPLPIDQRGNRLVPFAPIWPGLVANALLFAVFPCLPLLLAAPRLLPQDHGQVLPPLLDGRWLWVRLCISLALGFVLTIGSTLLYSLAPRTCLSGAEAAIGRTELAPGKFWVARRYGGTGAVLNALYVPDPAAPKADDSWDSTALPPAETIPDAWCAPLVEELARNEIDVGRGRFAIGFGWPWPAMWLAHDWQGSGLGASNARFMRSAAYGGVAPGDSARGIHVSFPRAVPVDPIWGGMALNTIAFGGAVMSGFLAMAVWRRLARRFNGQCVVCGYLLDASMSECPWCRKRAREAQALPDLDATPARPAPAPGKHGAPYVIRGRADS